MGRRVDRSNEPDPRLLHWGVRTVKAVPGVSPGRGRGLFAATPIAAGEIIDRACTTFIDAEQCLKLDATLPVGDHYFEHPEDKRLGLMVFGLVSLANHSEQPNAEVRYEDGGACGWVSVLRALADISEGEEITHRYKTLWFDPA